MQLSLKRKRPPRVQHVIRCSRCAERLTLQDTLVRDGADGFAHTKCAANRKFSDR